MGADNEPPAMGRRINYRDGIAAFQIVCFSVFFICAIGMIRARKHGWFFVGGLAVIRLVGASCLLGTLKSDARSLWAGVYVCESLGVLLLTFLLLGILERANHFVSLLNRWFFRAPLIFSWAGVGLTVAGYALTVRKGTAYDAISVAGLVMFLAIYLGTAACALFFLLRRAAFAEHDGERRQVNSVAVCVPILGLRVAYTLASRLSPPGYETFNPVRGGDATAYLFMVVFAEIGVAATATTTIFLHGRDWKQYEKSPHESVDEQPLRLERLTG